MTHQFLRMTLLIVVVLFIAACGVMEKKEGESAAADKATFEQVYQQAEDALKKATEVGYAWRDTGQFLDSAKEAAAKEDYAQAISLAQKAKSEGDAAYSQYEAQRNAGPYLF